MAVVSLSLSVGSSGEVTSDSLLLVAERDAATAALPPCWKSKCGGE